MKIIRVAVLVSVAAVTTGMVSAQTPTRQLRATYTEDEITLDGFLEEPAWARAEVTSSFIQQEPNFGAPSTEKTEVRILYDSKNLYVGVLCHDSEGPGGLTINDLTRDFNTLAGDVFTILLGTYGDQRNGFLFGTNPAGARFDTQIADNGGNSNRNWDGIWYVHTQITSQGWQAEFSIPFLTLRFKGQGQQQWDLNFLRRIRRKTEDALWSVVPRPFRVNRLSEAGILTGIEEVRQGRNLYLKPYVTAAVTRLEDDDVDIKPDAGVDLKYGLTSQVTLDLTVNTDFAQVEADEQQINLTRFNLFFPEKRDFFLESSGIFSFGPNPATEFRRPELVPFFSRRIGISEDEEVPILGGARLTGRLKANTLGLLSIQTDETDLEPSTNFTVLRMRRDVQQNSDVGVLFVNKAPSDGNFNRTFGFDANFLFWRDFSFNSYYLRTDEPDQQSGNQAGFIGFFWRDPFWNVAASHFNVGENFSPEVGYVQRTDIRKSRGEFGIRPRPGEAIPWIRQIGPSVELDYITDQDGLLVTRLSEANISINFDDGSNLWISRQNQFERLVEDFELREDREETAENEEVIIPPGDYNFASTILFYRSDQSRIISGRARLQTGDFWDGTRQAYMLALDLRPGSRFSTSLSWNRNDIELPEGAFKTTLVSGRVGYSFSTNMFLNALLQYNSDRGEYSTNVRYNFIHKPLSDLFIVYNERRDRGGQLLDWAVIVKLTHIFSF